MKKLFLLFAVAGMFTFASCGGEQTEEASEEDTEEVVEDEMVEEEPMMEEEPMEEEPMMEEEMPTDSAEVEGEVDPAVEEAPEEEGVE
ncbi:MAG: hypothetical protein AAF734_01310 [Bacteroidota bacterium]